MLEDFLARFKRYEGQNTHICFWVEEKCFSKKDKLLLTSALFMRTIFISVVI